MPGPREQHNPAVPLVSDQELEQIMAGDARKLVEVAERLGKDFARNGLSTSQIRNVFGAVKRLQMKGQFDQQAARELILLKPKLAYQAGRHGDTVKHLGQVLSKAIDRVESDPKRFENFADFFEAILAYHKAYGGK
ncbi:MAG: type III-A CRISPR-associated protein Csm2 [Candidatus Methanomethylicaceae archaeon]